MGLETETQDRTEFWEQGRVKASVLTERSRWGFTVLIPHLIYIQRTISTTILGSAVKNNSNDSARDKKYYCGNKEASL